MSVGTRSQQWQSSPEPQKWGKIPWWLMALCLVVVVVLAILVGQLVQSYNLAKVQTNTVVGSLQNKSPLPGETPFANVTLQFTNTSQGCSVHRFGIGTVSSASNFFPKPCSELSDDDIFNWLETTIDEKNRWIVGKLRLLAH